MKGILFLLSVLVLVIPLSNAAAVTTLCSYNGPDTSDGLELTGFKVKGMSNPEVGDSLSVEFKLRNYGQYALKFAKNGAFGAVEDPDGDESQEGNTKKNDIISPGESVSVSGTINLDEDGEWEMWPSYHLDQGEFGTTYGPEKWHSCKIDVDSPPPPQDSDNDGIPDTQDNCPNDPNQGQEDDDNDGIGDECDNCVNDYNPQQEDEDQDGTGDACEQQAAEPDLYFDKVNWLPTEIIEGQEITIRVYIEADEDAGDAEGDIEADVYLDGKLIERLEFDDRIKSGDRDKEEFEWTFDSPGVYQLKLVADPKNEIDEENEKNNEYSVALEVFEYSEKEEFEYEEPPQVIEEEPEFLFQMPRDSDHDGVYDYEDTCQYTNLGTEDVDENGCGCFEADADRSRFERGSIILDEEAERGGEGLRITGTVEWDMCINDTHLEQFHCADDNEMTSEVIECIAGCFGGACSCGDSDQINYYERGYHYESDFEDPPMHAMMSAEALRSEGIGLLVLNGVMFATADDEDEFMMSGSVGLVGSLFDDDEGYDVLSARTAAPLREPVVTEFCIDDDTVLEYYGEAVGSGSGAYCAIRNTTHHCEYGCKAGACVPFPSGNEKNMDMYPEDSAFMISKGAPWQKILSYVPVVVWTEGTEIDTEAEVSHSYLLNRKYPYLIYGTDGSAIDVDSTVYFVQQYMPEEVMFLDEPDPRVSAILTLDNNVSREDIQNSPSVYMGAGMDEDQLSIISSSEYYSFWETINTFVICENDYETGLVCAEYAALLNAPLLFDRYTANWEAVYAKNAIVIGSLSSRGRERLEASANIIAEYSMEEAQEQYADITGTDKMLLVNPEDLDIYSFMDFRPKRITNEYHRLYSSDSLTAPYLAAAKREVIITTPDRNYDHIDEHINSEMERLGIEGKGSSPPYLTILGSPNAIPVAQYDPHRASAKIYGDIVVYLDMPDGNLDVFAYNISSDTTTKISSSDENDLEASIYEDTIIYTSYGGVGARNSDVIYKSMGSVSSVAKATTGEMEGQGVMYDTQFAWMKGSGWGIIYACDNLLPTTHQGSCTGLGPNDMTGGNYTGKEPAIYGPWLVWTDKRNADDNHTYNYDIYLGNLRGTFRSQVTSTTNQEIRPQIYEDYIVWQGRDDDDNWHIYMCDMNLDGSDGGCLANDSKTKLSASGQNRYPSIWEDLVVWSTNTNSGLDFGIVVMNITSGVREEIFRSDSGMKAQSAPWIHEERVVFIVPEDSEGGVRRYVKVYDLESDSFIASIPTLISGGECNAGRTWLELDTRYYGTSGKNMEERDIATGRIAGITVSDTSSYINRELFLLDLPRHNNALVIIREHWGDGISFPDGRNGSIIGPYTRDLFWTPEVESQFSDVEFIAGHENVDVNPGQNYIRTHYNSSYLIVYDDHGWTEGFAETMSTSYLRDNNMWMYPSTVMSVACSTCDFHRSDKRDMFCANNIRYGALHFHGATGMGYWHMEFPEMLEGTFVEGKSMGQAFMEAKNADREFSMGTDYGTYLGGLGDPVQIMWGDPTQHPKWWYSR